MERRRGGAASTGEAAFPSLAFDNAGRPHVAFKDSANGSKTTVMKLVGEAWVPVGSVGLSTGAALLQQLAFEGATPYVAYAGEGMAPAVKITVRKFDGTAWSVVGAATTTGSNDDGLAMSVGGGRVFLALRDATGNPKSVSVIQIGR